MSFKDSRLGGFLEGVWHGFVIFGVIFFLLLLLARWAAADELQHVEKARIMYGTTYDAPWVYLQIEGSPAYVTYIDRKDRDSYCKRTNDFLTILQEMIDKEVAQNPSVRALYTQSEEGIRRAWCK